MAGSVCSSCGQGFCEQVSRCGVCGAGGVRSLAESEDFLLIEAEKAGRQIRKYGIDELVCGLDCVILNVEPENLAFCVQEFLDYTGLDFESAYAGDEIRQCILGGVGQSGFLVQSRLGGSPFAGYNRGDKIGQMPRTRLETLVFEVSDLGMFYEIQKGRGVRFMTEGIVEAENFRFFQTIPSGYSGDSVGFIEWTGRRGCYYSRDDQELDMLFIKPDNEDLLRIGRVDHVESWVRDYDRDAAVIEFIHISGFEFGGVYGVDGLGGILGSAMSRDGDFSIGFVSDAKCSGGMGPVEEFVSSFGRRVHHLAFAVEDIENAVCAVEREGLEFAADLSGNSADGVVNAFGFVSPYSLLANEYLQRFGNYRGLYPKSMLHKLF